MTSHERTKNLISGEYVHSFYVYIVIMSRQFWTLRAFFMRWSCLTPRL